jgi:DNA-binding SARP family transcriptional activator
VSRDDIGCLLDAMWVDDLAFEAALLPLEAGRVVPAGRLVEAVWRGNPPPGAAKTLQSYVSRLRAAPEPDVAQALVLVGEAGGWPPR